MASPGSWLGKLREVNRAISLILLRTLIVILSAMLKANEPWKHARTA